MYNFITIRYGELSLKGKNKNLFIKQLQNNLQKKLNFLNLKIVNKWSHFEVQLEPNTNNDDLQKISKIISSVFGISSFSFCIQTAMDQESIIQSILKFLDYSKPISFKIEVNRRDKDFNFTSSEFKKIIGIEVCKRSNIPGDLINPHKKIFLDLYKNVCNIYVDKIICKNGLPVGTSGKALLMISGGIDSPVAAYLLMKRGVEVEYVHFVTPPHSSDESLMKVKKIIKKLNNFCHKPQILHIVDFSKMQHEIMCTVKENYRIAIMRRFFYRLSEAIMKKNNIRALATGESLGQVASQTIENLNTIQSASHTLVLRPLITWNKEEIIELAKEIETFDISIEPFEDCCTLFVPKAPVTKSLDKIAQQQEEKMYSSEIFEWILSNGTEKVIIN